VNHLTYQNAVESGHLKCMQYLDQLKCPRGAEHRRLLEAQPRGSHEPLEIHELASLAIGNGHWNCVQYLLDTGMNWSKQYVETASEYLWAAHNCDLKGLQFLHEHHCPRNAANTPSDLWTEIAKKGRLDCMIYLRSQNWPWYDQYGDPVCCYAAKNGNLECMTFAHEHGCAMTDKTIIAAAKGGHIDCMIYAHTHGCHLTVKTTRVAAGYGRLTCLMYAIEHGCPCDEFTYYRAIAGGHLECLRYLDQHVCPRSHHPILTAVAWEQPHCIPYLHQRGDHWIGNGREYCCTNDTNLLKYFRDHGCPRKSKM